MNGVSGNITFIQSPSLGNLTMIRISLRGLDQYPSETFPWHVHNYPFTTQERDPCSAGSVGGHFDPFMASSRPNYSTSCSSNRSLCEVGDLSGKFGNLPTSLLFFMDTYLPLYGVHSIVGRSVVIHRNDGSRWVCANIEYPSDVTVAYSPFRNVFAGDIFFIEPYSPMSLTTVFVQLSYISGSVNSTAHNWHVHNNPIGGSGNCDDGGPHYNPRGINVNSPDYSYCSPSNQTACEIGDLTGKGAQLNFKNGRSVAFYTDTELPLRDNGLDETILRRSVVVHASNAGAARIGCANLIEYTARVAVVSFGEAGVNGQIIFKQSSPFSPTTVRVQLNGLSSRADGYHVHEFPVDEAIQSSSKCTAAGGHYNPRNIVRNSSSPTTFDAYEIGDLSGKFGGLLGLNSINSNYSDPYLSLFGTESIVGRSIVIHEPSARGDRWLCANIGYDMEASEVFSVTTNINSDTLQGRLVLTQLANDPYSETTILLDFNVGPPVLFSSSSSTPMMTPTPTQSMDNTSSSSLVMPSLPSSESSVVTSTSITTRSSSATPMLSVTSMFSTTATSSTTTSVFTTALTSSDVLSSSDTSSMVMTTTMMSSSSQVITSVTPVTQSASSMTSIVTSSDISPTTSSVTDDKTSDDKPVATSMEITSITTAISSSVSTDSTTLVATALDSMSLDVGSGFMLSSPTPSVSPTGKPDERRKKDVLRRQMQGTDDIFLSIQSDCQPRAPVANPYSVSASCSPANQLACPIGDLTGKHGPLPPGRNLLTDLNLPLTGPNSSKFMICLLFSSSSLLFCLSLLVAGMAVAVRIGDANSPIVECVALPLSLFPSPTTTPTPSASATPGTQEEGESGDSLITTVIMNGHNITSFLLQMMTT